MEIQDILNEVLAGTLTEPTVYVGQVFLFKTGNLEAVILVTDL